MTTVAIRLPDRLVETLDELVRQGRYANRTAAMRDAVERLLAAEARRAVDEAILAGYERTPPEPPDDAVRLLAGRSVRQEPW
jgi:Arc/MetJ-type ribon-helix-helix transcriptional regulator